MKKKQKVISEWLTRGMELCIEKAMVEFIMKLGEEFAR